MSDRTPLDLFDRGMELQKAEREPLEYQLRDAAFAMQPQPPVEWVVDGLIPRGTVSVFYGEPGAFKTWAMIWMAVRVAQGEEWLEYPTQQNTALYLDEESGESWFSRRLQQTIKGALGNEDIPINFVCNSGLMLDDKIDVEEIEYLIRSTGAKLVIFDALTDIMSGDENSKKDVQPIFAKMKRIANKTGAAIIVIHHSAKHGSYRGSSAIKGAVDLLMKIESKEDSDFINFKAEKVRHTEYAKFSAMATITEDQFYLVRVDEQEQPKVLSKSKKYVLRYLESVGGVALVPDIMANADICSGAAARSAVYALADDGYCYRSNPGLPKGRGNAAEYTLIPQEDGIPTGEKYHDV